MEIFHLSHLLPEKAKEFGKRIAIRYRDYKDAKWKGVSWDELNRQSELAAAALLEYSIKPLDKIGIFSQNKPECIISETAGYALRVASIPMYATSTTSQIEYIIKDADVHLIFAGEQYQYDRAFEALQGGQCGLKQIIIFDTDVRLHRDDKTSVYFKDFLHSGLISNRSDEVEEIRANSRPEDIANILYTSGTTGHPKGVILLHSNFQEIIRVMDIKLFPVLKKNDVSISFLPLTHVFEKAWAYYCLERDIRVDINLKPIDIQQSIREVRPSIMCSVPRFWEKAYAGIQEKMNEFSPFMKKVFNHALCVGKRFNLDYRRLDKKAPFHISFQYWLFNETVFKKVKKTIGIENGVLFPTAGAKLSDEISTFIRSMGIPLYYGYGLTESTATVSCYDKRNYEIGTVGSIVDKLQVRIDKNGEILLKGGTITTGYYNNPQANAESFTEDGFFRTGDMGYIDEKGNLVLTDRLKDLFKTSNGKYIAPQNIESALCNDRYIDLAAVIGDQYKFVSALIVPTYSEIPGLLKSLSITDLPADDMKAILSDERIHTFFENRIRLIQKDMAGFEQIRRFILLPETFSMEKGELTNTLKIKRKAVYENHKKEIENLYKS